MKAFGRYTAAATAVVLLGTAAAWVFLSAGGRQSVLTAALIALPTQLGFFALLARSQGDAQRFMIWWGAGALGRLTLLAAVGLSMGRLGVAEPGVLLMTLAGFLFVLLLLEPLFLDTGNSTAQVAQ